MWENLNALIPIASLIIGMFLQHLLSKQKHINEQLRIRRLDAYVDYLSQLARLKADQVGTKTVDTGPLIAAKNRIVIFGSDSVLKKMELLEEHAVLSSDEAQIAFTELVIDMRKDTTTKEGLITRNSIRVILFGKD